MKIEQIIYLDDISKTHSISQTAQRFFISQQALSFSLTKLEEEFGVILLERTNHGAKLTPEGILFLEKSKPILDNYVELKRELLLHSAEYSGEELNPDGTLTIYSHTRILEPLLVSLLEQYSRRYPNVLIQLYENENIETMEAISQKKGDFGLIFIPDFLVEENTDYILPKNICLEQLYPDDFVLCCSNNHPLKNKKALKMQDFSTIPMLLFDTNKILSKHDANSLSHVYFSNNMAFHKAMIRRGLAVSLITAFEFRKLYLKHKDIIALPILDGPKSIITLVLNSDKPPSAAAQLFINMLRKYDFYGM